MITLEDNYVSVFLAPLLKLNREWLRKYIKGHRRMVNSYLYHEGLGGYEEDCLSLVIHNYQTPDFREEEDKILLHPDVIGYYDIADTKFGVIVFNMSRYPDYYKFMEGKYSEFSDWAKELIVEKPIVDMGLAIQAKGLMEKTEAMIEAVALKFDIPIDKVREMEEIGSIWSDTPISNVLTLDIVEQLEKSGKLKIKAV